MHKFKTYLRENLPGDVERAAFAKRCGTTAEQLRQVAYGRRCGEKLAILIERETAGAVRCEDLRPDVAWEVIRNTKPKKRKAA